MTSSTSPPKSTRVLPRYYEGPADTSGDLRQHQRYFTYHTEAGLVTGCDTTVKFTLDRTPSQAWPIFKDFNRWQNAYGYYYSGVVGDLEGKTFHLGTSPNELGARHQYEVVRVIPEYLIVLSQPIAEDGSTVPGLPGLGGVSPGFHTFLLQQEDGKTLVTGLMEHASRTEGLTEEQALKPWREMTPGWIGFWRDVFVPNLKKLVAAAR